MEWWAVYIYRSVLEPAEISGMVPLSLLHIAFSNIHLQVMYVLSPILQMERLRFSVVPPDDMPFT